jgi:calcineurin-like phosphoesterase family protein
VQRRIQAYRPVLFVMVLLIAVAVLLSRIPPRHGAARQSAGNPTTTPELSGSPVTSPGATGPEPSILLAVGDIAYCRGSADEAVGKLAARLPGTIALLGDIAYPNGSSSDYADCFDPTWGAMRDRLRPVPGNHEYETSQASAYFTYFGAAAADRGQGWYSYDLGAWHVVALNSECDAIGGCGMGSPEQSWLVSDLAAHPATCTLAYWHHPRYSSGLHGSNDMTAALWSTLADAGADLVLSGHDHDYERIGPVDGIRSFVVGTGGRSLYAWPGSPGPHTERRANDAYGLLELTLNPASFGWRFIRAAGGSFSDAGSAPCH